MSAEVHLVKPSPQEFRNCLVTQPLKRKAYLTQAEKPAETEEEISKEDAREYRAIEDELKSFFSTKVKLKPLGKRNKGKIEIEYYSDEDLERLLALLKK